MKLTVFQFEGTPEELDASQTLRELTQSRNGSAAAMDTSPRPSFAGSEEGGHIPGVPEEGQDTVRGLLQHSPAPELFLRFLAVTAGWENVFVHGIKRKGAQPDVPLDYSRYLRLRRQGSQKGGFAYIYPERSSINLRLNYTDQQLEELGITTARTLTTGHREYRVSVDLSNEQSLADALELAELAYNAT
ncbi:hypothetical protein ABZ719_33255 [Streptomyces sp. NPDC006743]|uniref:hypothetical protein n=1 Tax=Streptomyces sp. NPDC006743 TaxID=3154480 RepID=UPI0034546FB5